MPPSAEQLAELRKKYHDKIWTRMKFRSRLRRKAQLAVPLAGTARRPAGHDRRIYLARGDKEINGKAVLPVAATDWFDSQRGWNLEPMSFFQKADSLSEAVRWGGQETWTRPSSCIERCTAS